MTENKKQINQLERELELCNPESKALTTYCIRYGNQDCKKTCYYAKEMKRK